MRNLNFIFLFTLIAFSTISPFQFQEAFAATPVISEVFLENDATIAIDFDATDVNSASIIASDFLVDGIVPNSVTFHDNDADNDGNDSVSLNFDADTFHTNDTPFFDLVGAIDDSTNVLSSHAITASDGAPPVVEYISLIDADNGGGSSVYRVYFSENIDSIASTAGNFAMGGNSAGTVTAISDPADSVNYIDLTVNETETATESGVTVAFTNDGDIVDASVDNNEATTFGATSVGAVPTIIDVDRTSTTTITIMLSEDVDGVADDSSWSLSAGTVSNISDPAGSSNIVTLTVSGLSGTDDTPTATYSATNGALVDDDTNELANSSAAAAFDEVAPTISSAVTGDSGAGLDKVTITFSENVDAAKTDGSGWTVTGTDAGSRTVTANTDPAGASNTMVLTLSSGFASENPNAEVTYTNSANFDLVDVEHNQAATGASPNITDGISPVISSETISNSDFVPSGFSVGWTNSEAVASGTISFARTGGTSDATTHDYTMSGGDLAASANTVSQATLEGDGSFADLVDGSEYTITIDTTDAAGNTATQSSTTVVTFDETAPGAPAITLDGITDPSNDDPVLFTVDFGEDITASTFIISDVTANSGTVQSIVDSGDGQNFTFQVASPTDNVALTVQIASGAVDDLAGNSSTTISNLLSVDVDRTAPTAITNTNLVSSNTDNSLAVEGDILTLTFSTNEAIATPTVTIATQTASVSGGPTSWSATYTTAEADSGVTDTGNAAISITYEDTAGNTGASSPDSDIDSGEITFDFTAPTPTITSSDGLNDSTTNADPINFSISFDESVTTTFTSGEVTVTGTANPGVVTDFAGTNAGPYTFTIAPTNDGTVIIDVTGSVATDAAGNNNAVASQFIITSDKSSVTSATSYTASTVKDEDSQTITILFDQAVTGTPNITLTGSSSGVLVNAQVMSDSGDQTTWTYNTGTTHTGDETVTVTLGGTVADNAGNAISVTPTSNTFTIDNTAPDFVSTFLSGSKSLTVLYDEPVTTVAGHYTLISVDGGATETATSVDTSTSNSILIKWTSASAVATDGITFTIGSVTDVAGNALSNGGAKTIQAQAAEAVATTTLTDNDGDGDVEITISADTLINTIVAPANTIPVVSVADFAVAPAGDIEDAKVALGGSASTAAFPAQPITVQSDTATIVFPPSLQVLFPDGDETIKIAVSTKKPTNDSDFVAAFPNVDLTTANVVEFGNPDTNLTFSAPVKITIAGLSGTVFTIDKDGDTKEILTCDVTVVSSATANTFIGTITGNATTDGEACFTGNDIWTKHFSGFGSSSAASSGGGSSGDTTSPTISTNSFSSANMGFGGMLSLDPNAVASENLFFVGEKIDFVFEFYENSGLGVEHIELVTGIRDNQTIFDSELWIEYNRGEEPIIRDSEEYWSDAGITIVGTGDKPRVIFSAVFDKPMETSDIIVRIWDTKRNSIDIEFENVIKVINSPTGFTLDEPESIVIETTETIEPITDVTSSTMVWGTEIEDDEVGVYTKASLGDLEDKIRVLRSLANNVEIQNELIQSNAEFESLDDPYSIIDQLDAEWVSNPKTVTEFMQSLMNNESALIAKALIEHHQDDLVPLISITIANTYGVNTVITEKTQDYIQSDESWWDKTKESGIYIMSGYAGEGYTGLNTFEISKIISDSEGNFIGIIKATVNLENAFLSE